MVVSEKVQDAVYEQPGHTFSQKDAGAFSFGGSGVHGDDHIAQQLGCNLGKITFAHGK